VAEVLLGGQRTQPTKLIETQYSFRFPALKDALADLLG
jgi:NAD dependent epimerase/dehydratase family enzyme